MLGWQRINPRVVFDPELFVNNPAAREMEVVYDALATNIPTNNQASQYWKALNLNAGETYAKILHILFEPWTASNHLWEE